MMMFEKCGWKSGNYDFSFLCTLFIKSLIYLIFISAHIKPNSDLYDSPRNKFSIVNVFYMNLLMISQDQNILFSSIIRNQFLKIRNRSYLFLVNTYLSGNICIYFSSGFIQRGLFLLMPKKIFGK